MLNNQDRYEEYINDFFDRYSVDSELFKYNLVDAYNYLVNKGNKVHLELLKGEIAIKMGIELLEKNPNLKLVLNVHRIVCKRALYHLSKFYNVATVYKHIDNFNKPDLEYRVIISPCGLDGISLHDIDGRFPRTMICIPEKGFNTDRYMALIVRARKNSVATGLFLYDDLSVIRIIKN